LMAGMAIMAAGYVVAILLGTQVWWIILASVIIGAGLGVAYASMPALIMRSVPPSETAAANGLNALVRSMGSTIASAVIGAVLAHITMTMGGISLPSQRGFQVALLISATAAVLALLVAALIPTRQRARRRAEDEEDTLGSEGSGLPFELEAVPESN
jgi:MFS family permease